MSRSHEGTSGSLGDNADLFDYFQRPDVDIDHDVTLTIILPGGKIVKEKFSPRTTLVDIKDRVWVIISKTRYLDQIKLRNRHNSKTERKLIKSDLRFKGVRVNSNEFYEFSERDEYSELHTLQLFSFQLRLDLSICSEKQEKTIQNHDIKEIIGAHHMETLRASIVSSRESLLHADTKKYTEVNSEQCAFHELDTMSQELVHFANETYLDVIKSDQSDDDKWRRDFGAEVVKNIIQTEFKEDDWPKTDSEKTTIELNIDLSKWLTYQNIEKALPKIKTFLFGNTKSVTELLEKIQKDVQKLIQLSDTALPDVDPKVDYLMIEGRAEILLPRNEQLRNFMSLQKSKYECVKLWLVRDLCELIPKYIPWNATVPMNVVDRKLPMILNPYEGILNIIDQDQTKLNHDLTLRVLIMKDIRGLVGRITQYKAALIFGRQVLCSVLDGNFNMNMTSLKPTFKFTDCKMSDLPRMTKVCISIFVIDDKNDSRVLVGYTNFRLFNQFGICHFRETLKIHMTHPQFPKHPNLGIGHGDQELSTSNDNNFIPDQKRDHFFIGDLGQPDIAHSELSVRLSVDDGFMKPRLKAGAKSRPAQLVRFKPARVIKINSSASVVSEMRDPSDMHTSGVACV